MIKSWFTIYEDKVYDFATLRATLESLESSLVFSSVDSYNSVYPGANFLKDSAPGATYPDEYSAT